MIGGTGIPFALLCVPAMAEKPIFQEHIIVFRAKLRIQFP